MLKHWNKPCTDLAWLNTPTRRGGWGPGMIFFTRLYTGFEEITGMRQRRLARYLRLQRELSENSRLRDPGFLEDISAGMNRSRWMIMGEDVRELTFWMSTRAAALHHLNEAIRASQPAKGFGLQFLSGEMAGKVVILQPGQKWILGRGADADLPIADKSLSRKHCELETTGETVKVTDLGSSNGSYVNKEKVKEAKLELGDQLRIGKSNMVLIEPPSNTENTSVLKKLAADSDSEVSGRLESLPLMDLLQLLSNSVKTG